MSSIRQKWSPITQNTYDDKKYRQHIAIITYLLPLGCSCVGCFREGCCMLGMCTSSTQFLHIAKLVGIKYEKAFLKLFWIWYFSSTTSSNIFDCESSDVACVCVHLFPAWHAFWLLKKPMLRGICVSGTVPMFQLTWNCTACVYKGQDPHMLKQR